MNLNQKNIRKIRGLILFAAVVILALMKFDLLCSAAFFIIQILRPFMVGGMIAFVINIPMRFFETKLLKGERIKNRKNDYLKKGRRGLSIALSFLVVILVITLVAVTVIPQLVATIKVLTDEIPVFWGNVIKELEVLFAANPELIQVLNDFETMEIDWQKIMSTVIEFLRNGMSDMLSSTFSVASSIISSTVNFFIALVFSIYILAQKEKLGDQFTRFLKAYTSPKIYKNVLKEIGRAHV